MQEINDAVKKQAVKFWFRFNHSDHMRDIINKSPYYDFKKDSSAGFRYKMETGRDLGPAPDYSNDNFITKFFKILFRSKLQKEEDYFRRYGVTKAAFKKFDNVMKSNKKNLTLEDFKP